MITVIVSKKIAKQDDLIVIPRKEYEELVRLRLKNIKEAELTVVQRRALTRARKNMSQGKLLTIHELRKKLERSN